MINSYWDLYLEYIKKCVNDNWINDVDPHHYQMEWNHWLPKACFPDLPLGQWLTLRQHAVASALQTLALKENCMCGWHKKHLPSQLLELAWPYYCEAAKKAYEKLHPKKDKFGRSAYAMGLLEKVNEEKDEFGRSLNAVKAVKRMNEVTHAEKDEFGRSLNAVKAVKKMQEVVHAEKDELGRSVHGVKSAEKLHEEKDEFGKSFNAVKAGEVTSSQVWESTKDGFTGNAGNVAQHNRARGWSPNDRKRVS